MSTRVWIVLGTTLFISVLAMWVALGILSAWPVSIIAASALPLGVSTASMFGLSPKAFFYAALVLMLYIAFAITHVLVATEGRGLAVLILGASLAYLAVLKFVLQALNARRQHRQASS